MILRIVIGAILGAGIGYGMHRFIGCQSGACPLVGNRYMAIIIWGLIGMLMAAGR